MKRYAIVCAVGLCLGCQFAESTWKDVDQVQLDRIMAIAQVDDLEALFTGHAPLIESQLEQDWNLDVTGVFLEPDGVVVARVAPLWDEMIEFSVDQAAEDQTSPTNWVKVGTGAIAMLGMAALGYRGRRTRKKKEEGES